MNGNTLDAKRNVPAYKVLKLAVPSSIAVATAIPWGLIWSYQVSYAFTQYLYKENIAYRHERKYSLSEIAGQVLHRLI
ncbi:hypothetical protein LQZ18_18600 [Lachnospiraceae bacterium ZAX-1]